MARLYSPKHTTTQKQTQSDTPPNTQTHKKTLIIEKTAQNRQKKCIFAKKIKVCVASEKSV
jgi:hypothetical protein